MKKLLLLIMCLSAISFAQQGGRKKVISDPAEYSAYVGAVQQEGKVDREIALESFLKSYPNSVMKEDALETLAKLYQQTGPLSKFMSSADRLLQVNPNNLTGLALLTYVDQDLADANPRSPNAEQLRAEATEMANRGLDLLPSAGKPDQISDADWAKIKSAYRSIFLKSAK